MEIKLCLGFKGKSYNKTISDSEFNIFRGKKLGDKVTGLSDLKGYEFLITGGSDKSGFPMRKDIDGSLRKKAFLSGGVGVHIKRKGMRVRKSVRGNLIAEDIVQINLKVLKEGEKKLDDILGKEEKKDEVKEEPKEKKKVEEKKPEPKKEETKKEEVKEEKKEEVKEKPKEEPKKEEPKKEEVKEEKKVEDKKEVKEEKVENKVEDKKEEK